MSITTLTETIELQPASFSPKHGLSHARYSLESGRARLAVPVISKDNDTAHSSSVAASGQRISKLRLVLTILQPSAINFFASFTNGAITVGLPIIAHSIFLPRELYLWPSSVYGLTSGAMLLIAGSIADIVGARIVELAGTLLLGIFTLGCGLSTTGVQLVLFRALQGIALAMHLPSSVALIAAAVPQGRARNIGFACLGLSQPLGFSVGLVVSGVIVEKTGWRAGFYLAGASILVVTVVSFCLLPKVKTEGQAETRKELWNKVCQDIDWVGGIIASGGLAMLAYVLAMLSADLSTIRSAETAILLSLSLILLIAFPLWMEYQTRRGKPALVPNRLWKNIPFASTCGMVALSYGAMNAMELFSSLYFQEIQKATVLTTSLYLLPNLLVGVCINLSVGVFVDRVPARWLVVVSSILCSTASLMMVLANPSWSYWYMEFWAQVFAPFSGDVLFTVGLIIVSDSFAEKMQALAGAVFNTVAQFGMSLGMGLCQVVALGVMGKVGEAGVEGNGNSKAFGNADQSALLKGYRAGFWTMFACMIACSSIGVVGLRKVGKVGLKRE